MKTLDEIITLLTKDEYARTNESCWLAHGYSIAALLGDLEALRDSWRAERRTAAELDCSQIETIACLKSEILDLEREAFGGSP